MDNRLQSRATQQPSPSPGAPAPGTPAPTGATRKPRRTVRRWLVPLLIFLLGVVIGMLVLTIFALFIAQDIPPLPLPPSTGGKDLEVRVSPAYLTHQVSRALNSASLPVPATFSNERVTLANGDQMTVNGDETIGVAGFGVKNHFIVIVQPIIVSCQIQVHVLHAQVNNQSVTQFTTIFEAAVDQQLQVNLTQFPPGFTYCTSSVSTETSDLIVTYSATPT